MTLKDYYNRFDTAKRYEKTMFRAGKGLQSAELNEIQENALHKIKGIGDAIFRDGDVLKDATCVVNPDTGETSIGDGVVYLRGSARDVTGSSMTIPVDATVKVGLYYTEITVTELEDPALRDPAVGTRNYQEPGAGRLKVNLTWGFEIDGQSIQGKGEFYPIYVVENGVLVLQAPPPQLDAVSMALARYDRESNGSYVVNGMRVRYLGSSSGKQTFVVEEGKAHVDGFEITLPHSLRSLFNENPDIQTIDSEPHTYQADNDGNMRVNVNNAPIKDVLAVDVTAEKTVTVTHGGFSGAVDPLPDESVLEIVKVEQGQVTFVQGSDYRLTGGDLDWSPGGTEPAPGSSYKVTYRFRKKVTPTEVDADGFTITGAVEGSLLLIDYSWKMPRYDLITIDRQGKVRRIEGASHPWRPSTPSAPAGQLGLAYIEQRWRDEVLVSNSAVHAIPMRELEAMQESIFDLFDLVAQERLRNDANMQDPSAKRGVFVDPFLDDDMRDQGIVQTAAIVDGELGLPIAAGVADLARFKEPVTLPYELEPILEQLAQTNDMKVNPYQAFSPVPAKVSLNLSVDRWTDIRTEWLSPVTQRFSVLTSPITNTVVVGWGFRAWEASRVTQNVTIATRRSEFNQLVTSNSREAEFMREVTQEFELEGFQPGEQLTIRFDGIDIPVGD